MNEFGSDAPPSAGCLAVVLAAVKGRGCGRTGPRSERYAGRSVLGHVLAVIGRRCFPNRRHRRTGPREVAAKPAATHPRRSVVQGERLGPAMRSSARVKRSKKMTISSSLSDTPLVTAETFATAARSARRERGGRVARIRCHDPTGYGRLIITGDESSRSGSIRMRPGRTGHYPVQWRSDGPAWRRGPRDPRADRQRKTPRAIISLTDAVAVARQLGHRVVR